MKNIKQNWFTMVELIVVIIILVVLSTVWFVTYSKHISWTRDVSRISYLKSISNSLETYSVANNLPFPDDYVEIKIWTWSDKETVAYQGYIWVEVQKIIEYSSKLKDPKNDTYFTYYLAKNRKYFQLMWFLEKQENLQTNNVLLNKIYAIDIDYKTRFPQSYGKNIWLLTDLDNQPAQELDTYTASWIIDLWDTHSWVVFKSYIDIDWISLEWYKLQHILESRTSEIYEQPSECPDWFIPIPWNAQFNQIWFCVAKYEMTYTEEDSISSPNSTEWWTDYNTYTYSWILNIASRKWWYPIADITQSEAISACKTLWEWYHLITNNEWMTIARNIELNKENWEWDYIINWNSSNTSMWCDDHTWWRAHATKTWPTENIICNKRRQLKLDNWETIRDLSWNVREHVNKANNISWIWSSEGQTVLSVTTANIEWNHSDISDQERLEYGPIIWTTSLNWIWILQDWQWVSNNIFVRWYCHTTSSPYVWIYRLNLWNNNSYKRNRTWFRCAK